MQLDSAQCEGLKGCLSPDELERAARFHFPQDRGRFIARRGILRQILSSYVGIPPAELKFQYAECGKPHLAEKQINPPSAIRHPQFSVSHSNGLALFAVSARPVGVDLEHIRSDFSFMDIARRFFHEEEIRYLDSLTVGDQPRAFFSLWTRKEAYLKALGLGLNASLSTRIMPDDAEIIGQEGEKWTLTDLEIGPDYSAALVSMGDRQPI